MTSKGADTTPDTDRKLATQAVYWRDQLMKAHGWVLAVELLVVGWLAAPGDTLNIFKTELQSKSGADPLHDAIGFLVGYPVVQLCYLRYVWWVYVDRLQGKELNSTVIPRNVITRFVIIKACVVYSVIVFAALG